MKTSFPFVGLAAAALLACSAAPEAEESLAEQSAALAPPFNIVHVRSTPSAEREQQVVAKCPAGKPVLGIGWTDQPLYVPGAVELLPDGSGYLAHATHGIKVPGELATFEVVIVCAYPAAVPNRELVFAESGAVDGTARKQLEVSCPTGKTAVGAGWSGLASDGTQVKTEALAYMPSPGAKGWRVAARSDDARPWKLRVGVICARGGSRVVETQRQIHDTVETTCPDGTQVAAAGWQGIDGEFNALDTWLCDEHAPSETARSWSTTCLANASVAGISTRTICLTPTNRSDRGVF
jgi:hypothetical protein